jgi:two-component system, NtrC family, sensor kinase
VKVSQKLALTLIGGISVIMTVHAYIRITQEIGRLRADQAQDQSKQGLVLAAAVERIWRIDGSEFARRVVGEMRVAGEEPRIAWRWLDELTTGRNGLVLSKEHVHTLRGGKQVELLRRDDSGDERLYALVPISVKGSRRAVLELSEELSPPHAYIRMRILQNLVAAIVVLALCASLAGGLGSWFVGRPLQRLCEKARRVGNGDFSGRLNFAQRDEVGQLASEIDAMCDRLVEANQRAAGETEARIAALDQLRHWDRLKTVGQLASGVAHELGTPLNVILGRAKMIAAGDLTPQDIERNSRIILQQTDRMTAIIRQLLDFARREQPRVHASRLDRIVERSLEMLGPLAVQQGVEVHLESCTEPTEVDVDEEQMLQALTNLVINGIQAMPTGGRLSVRIDRAQARPPAGHEGTPAEYVSTTVEDDGVGIPAEAIPHVFEPFFTTKGVGEGTGLGLSVAYGIVRDHGGWIEVASRPGKGSRFVLFLPPAARRPASAEGARV